MVHGDPPGVERLARKDARRRGEPRVRDLRPTGFAVYRIADDRPAARREVHADLMRAAGDEAAPDERQADGGGGHPRDPFEPCEAGGADVRRSDDPARIAAILGEPQIDLAACHVDAAVDDGEIVFLGGRGRRALERGVDRRGLGDDDDAGGQLVEAADERGPLRSRPAARVPQQGVQQRAGRVLVRRMHHHAGRLVQREQVFVLEEDVERHVFGRHLTAPGDALGREETATRSPSAARVATRRTGVPFTVTRPLAIHACTRVRLAVWISVRCRRSTRSRRLPASPRSAVRRRGGATTYLRHRTAEHETKITKAEEQVLASSWHRGFVVPRHT
jgi:hypothetical protein